MIVSRSFTVVLILSLCNGCSSDSGPRTVEATGTVLYNGEPVADAKVAFLGDGTIRPAVAVTDEDGYFALTTSRSGDGAVPGTHKVTVTKTVEPPKKKESSGSMSMEDAALAAQKPAKEAKTLYLIPEKYSSPDSSGLSFEVKDGEENHFEIKLQG